MGTETTTTATNHPRRPTPYFPTGLTDRGREVLTLGLTAARRDLHAAHAAHQLQAERLAWLLETRSRLIFDDPAMTTAEKATAQATLQAHVWRQCQAADAEHDNLACYLTRTVLEIEAALGARPDVPTPGELELLTVATSLAVTR